MSTDIETIVIGAGVVGLAVARELSLAGQEVLLVEATDAIGSGVSSRNSEVIHAGIYYPAGSLKARLCVQGKQQLYAYCAQRGIAHERLGKLIVAADAAQAQGLAGIARRARENGVDDLVPLTGEQARELEPELACHAALLSPSTGIVDSHALMLSLQGDAENAGAQLVFNTPLQQGVICDDGTFHLQFGDSEATELRCCRLINAAGLSAPLLAQRLQGYPPEHTPSAFYCKGSYFTLAGRSPFSRLIYPMPDHAGLGVHLTVDLGGQAKFGPDTEWIDTEDYQVDPQRADAFYAAVRSYWPALPDGALQPGYAGIRPKIVDHHAPAADFVIAGERTHGIANLVQLLGIESPGLTACLAIAQQTHTALNPHTP